MKPKPFSSLNHFTVPVGMSSSSLVEGKTVLARPGPLAAALALLLGDLAERRLPLPLRRALAARRERVVGIGAVHRQVRAREALAAADAELLRAAELRL